MSRVGKLEFSAGLMFRRRVRSRLAFSGLKSTEFPGLLDSWFVVEGDADDVWRFYEWAARESGEKIPEARRAMWQQERFP